MCKCKQTSRQCYLYAQVSFTVIHLLLQGMINQHPGVLLDLLVGIPGDRHATEASIVNFYSRRIQQVCARHCSNYNYNCCSFHT